MERITVSERPDWQAKVESVGFNYHSLGHNPAATGSDGLYWYERAAYKFTGTDTDYIYEATQELHARVLDAVDWVTRTPEELARFGLSPEWTAYVVRSWRRGDPAIMGRFDLAYDPATGGVKMLEYNADTPTLLIESSLVQWFWLKDKRADLDVAAADQFNSLHEKLLQAFRGIKGRLASDAILHVAALATYPEELQHARYFMDLAQQAGIDARFVSIADIGWREERTGRPDEFVDAEGVPIRFLHKLYPWEWMAQEEFGKHLLLDRIGIIEPPWKMIAASKALLPVLHHLFPDHPNLLPAAWTREEIAGDAIRKPTLGREGANMQVWR
ncbi:MAG: glutathionylspermidine synthase family protein, partial [Janthinobacterium lividum]